MIVKFKAHLFKILGKFSSYLLIVFTVLLAFSLIKNITNITKANDRIVSKEKKVEGLRRENYDLEKKLTSVKSEEFIEKQLRDKLGLAREGEIVVILPDEETLRKLAPKYAEEEEELPPPNWKKWLKLFL